MLKRTGKAFAKGVARGAVSGISKGAQAGLFGSGAFMPPPPSMPSIHNTGRRDTNHSALKLANGVAKSLFSHNTSHHHCRYFQTFYSFAQFENNYCCNQTP